MKTFDVAFSLKKTPIFYFEFYEVMCQKKRKTKHLARRKSENVQSFMANKLF